MTAIKLILFLLVAGLAVFWAWPKRRPGKSGVEDSWTIAPMKIAVGVVALITLLVTYPAIGVIEAGHRGVVTQFGAVTGQVLGEGFYMVTPFVNEVEIMSVKTEAYAVPAEAASNDLQDVKTKVTLNYSLDPGQVAEVYRTLRWDYEKIIIIPAVQEAVKAGTAQFTAEALIQQRPVVKDKIETALRTRLAVHGIRVDTISITDFNFSDSFNAAIEKKVTASQLALAAERDLVRVQFEAKQKITQAQAEATALQLQGSALKSSPELVALRQVEAFVKWIEKWNGQLPETMFSGSSGGVVPFFDVTPKK